MILVDTHAHLDFTHFDGDREEIIERARNNGVIYIVNVGSDLESSRNSLELAEEYPFIYAAVGVHPHDADKLDDTVLKELEELAVRQKVLAIGEIGLDYYYDNSPRDIQKEAFRNQLKLAEKTGLPFIIHNREADEDILAILKDNYTGNGGIMHCFGSGLKMAWECLELGLYLAFGGVITFKNAEELRGIVKEIPLERILLETDCPYLTPVPFRGRRNEPGYLRYIAEKIAEIRGLHPEELAEITTANAARVYNLPVEVQYQYQKRGSLK